MAERRIRVGGLGGDVMANREWDIPASGCTAWPRSRAFDAALVTGGLPIICARWRHGEAMRSFLARELANLVSPLVVSAQLSLGPRRRGRPERQGRGDL